MRPAPFLASLLLAALLAPPAAAAGYRVEVDGREIPVESRRFDGVSYLSAAGLAGAFGGSLQEDAASGNFILEIEGTRFILSAREGLVSIQGRIISLQHPNRRGDDGDLWISPEFVDQALKLFHPRSIRRVGSRIFVGGAPPAYARLRTSQDAAGTRVVLEFTRPVRVEHQTGPRGVRLRVDDGPLSVEGLPRSVEGDLVTAVWYEPADSGIGGIFTFDPGPDYAGANVSYLEDPYRVVLDFFAAGGVRLPGEEETAPVPATGPDARGIDTIIIDAGHGGDEVGAQGPSGLFEKDVVLDIARRAASLLRRKLGISVVMTREVDKAIPLDERAGMANNAHGDLFVSIHANASRGTRASGAETYFLSMQATDEESASLARSENLAGGTATSTSKGDDLDMVLWDLAQSEHRIESFLLAETIQRDLNELLDTRDRGVRQAPFRVLMGVSMPAVLVEVAFISNPDEEAALRTNEFRDRIAQALAASIGRYKRSYEARLGREAEPSRSMGRGSP